VKRPLSLSYLGSLSCFTRPSSSSQQAGSFILKFHVLDGGRRKGMTKNGGMSEGRPVDSLVGNPLSLDRHSHTKHHHHMPINQSSLSIPRYPHHSICLVLNVFLYISVCECVCTSLTFTHYESDTTVVSQRDGPREPRRSVGSAGHLLDLFFEGVGIAVVHKALVTCGIMASTWIHSRLCSTSFCPTRENGCFSTQTTLVLIRIRTYMSYVERPGSKRNEDGGNKLSVTVTSTPRVVVLLSCVSNNNLRDPFTERGDLTWKDCFCYTVRKSHRRNGIW